MTTRRLLIAFVLLAAMNIAAAVRTQDDALRIAAEFTVPSGGMKAPARNLRPSAIALQDAAYIAVNTRGGYVLVGADDRLPEVLGYGDNGDFDAENQSPAFRYWMQCYAEELEAFNDQPSLISRQMAALPKAVEPLMTCKWNQSAPYNDLAPQYNSSGSKCVTGCVATAMAQVMYYYKYPTMGTGSHSYYWVCTEPVGASATLSANFGTTTYDWANMLDSYRSGYTTAQAEAVATLMYHCGVSIDMGYGSSSGAYTEKVPAALRDYFSYDGNYQRIQKLMYPADSLNSIIYGELSAQRPVIISGSNDEGGHAFVCDGCDKRGYFHINWGWAGSNDGYYLLTALNPGKSQGIGGTTKGYNKGTTFFIGLQPENAGTPAAIPQMATTDITVSSEQFSRSTSFSVSISKLQNYGLTNFSGSYGVALYDEDETNLVTVLKQENNYSLKAGYYRTTVATLSGIKIPNSVPAGTYHLCAVYKDADHDWMRMMCTQDDYYRTLALTNSEVTFYPNDAASELSLAAPIAFPEGVNTDSIPYTGMPLSFSVRNAGGTFRGEISARIYKGSFSKGQYEIMDSVVIRRNQSLSSALQQVFDENLLLDTQYKMKLCWRADKNDSWHDFTPAEYAVLPFKLYDPDPNLALTDTIRFDRNDSVPRSNATLHYSIKNTGAPFDGELQLSFYQENFSRGKSEIQTVHIGTNETLAGTFSGPLEQVEGTYQVILRYRMLDGEGYWQEFIDKNNYNIGSVVAFIYDDQPDDPGPITGINQAGLKNNSSALFVLRNGSYDLYLVPVSEGEKTVYHKVFVPAK
ncbi:MAG: C10 family peptidase [Paludibacteraceae bacterium]|nr:C10 family peptidase [Paludibacteraceae bacterium]